jgi:putative SOS response-associated peptidase YedK
MPVILDREDEGAWLDPDVIEPERIMPLLKPYPASKMEEWQVSEAARNPKNDFPDVLKPLNNRHFQYLS